MVLRAERIAETWPAGGPFTRLLAGARAELGTSAYTWAVSPLAILILSIGLAMDATAVAAASGLAAKRIELRNTVTIALAFGGAQALMPLLGAWLGGVIGPSVQAWDHWIAFVLLGGLGLKMLHEAWGAKAQDEATKV